ncbi:hypothetical protein [Staphylococcus agnetis]|uniref:hypothetical protein n=1 Tax=Staphylococcus agnetis TaxID=985762 RepID=UPI0004E3719B|nr:hypothetical protein [Staphylococcus agnetis]KFE41386.1 hypothetical protein SAGN_07683 [Staphylococcus agnetis]NJH65418.1 hypothetical protein [Staphylococcus agnetis]NJH98114.1 hypothetical protein [Staphylococcus agnetis]PTH73783.1 hypothetical protein BU581_04475 [Staphylococcus agnetis]PTH75155.1 hypothetical protein BU580_03750 [Staphylococcus agnetis]
MDQRYCSLQDGLYTESQTSLTFEFLKVTKEDELTIYDFKIIVSFENTHFHTDFSLFDMDIENLKKFKCKSRLSEIHFLEPDLTFTIIKRNRHDLTVFVTLDSGLRHSNCVSESGGTIKLNVTKKTFYQFLNELIKIEQYL